MYMIGQQIQIIVSSQRAAGAKIRTGSTGFISNIYGSMFLEKLDISLMYCNVLFNRYGFEQRHRCENKKVIIIFPCREIFLEGVKIKPQLNKMLKSVIDSTASIIDNFRNYDLKKKPIFIIATNINTDVYSSKEIHRAWFLSICNNKFLSDKFNSIKNSDYNNSTILFEKFKNKSERHAHILEEFLKSNKYNDFIRLSDLYYRAVIENKKEYIELINVFKIYIQLVNMSNISLAKRTLNFFSPLFFNLITAIYLLMNNKIGPFKNNQILLTHKISTQRISYWMNKINEIDLTKP